MSIEKELRQNWDSVVYPEPDVPEPPMLLAAGPADQTVVSDAGAGRGSYAGYNPRAAQLNLEPQAKMESYDPTVRQKIADFLQAGFEAFGTPRYQARKNAQTIMGGESSNLPLNMGIADIIPFLGTGLQTQEAVRTGEEAVQSLQAGEPGKAALQAGAAAIGMIPGAVGTANVIKQINKSRKFKQLDPVAADNVKIMLNEAEQVKPQFDQINRDIAEKVGGTYKAAPIKGVDRVIEKSTAEYGGDVTQIKDLVRSTIIVDSQQKVDDAIKMIAEKYEINPDTSRNLFNPNAVASKDGYRDAKFNVMLDGGMMMEIQINTPQMMMAKDKVHDLYKERRTIEAKLVKEKRDPTPDELVEISRLNAEMKSIYDAAFEDSSKSANSSLDSGLPLRRAESGSNQRDSGVSQAAE